MMNKLIFLFALCAGVAHADTVATLRNQSNGLIVLTDMKEGCSRYPGAAYTVSGNSNKTWWGCWYSDDLMVHIDWKDGEKTSYLVENFTINPEAVRKLRERKNSGGGQSL
jgi:hypothetical protein